MNPTPLARFALFASAFAVGSLGAGASPARTMSVPIPSGWAAMESAVAVTADRLAVATHPDHAGAGTRLVLAHGESVTHVDFPGKASPIEFSPDGRHLLVRELHPAPSGSPGDFTSTISLVDADASAIRWSRVDSRDFRSSTTGEVVYAWNGRGGEDLSPGPRVEIFGLDGKSIRTVDAGKPIAGAVALGDGSRVVVAIGRTVMCLDIADRPRTIWQFDSTERAIAYLSAAPGGRVLVGFALGAFRIVGADGAVAYDFEPSKLRSEYLAILPPASIARLRSNPGLPENSARDDAARAERRLRGLEPVAGDSADTLLLYDRLSSDSLVLDIPSGRLRRAGPEPAEPEGMHKGFVARGGRVVFIAKDRVIAAPFSEN